MAVWYAIAAVDEKIKINRWSEKEMENFIQASLSIIAWETVFQKALRTVLPAGGQNIVICVFEMKDYTLNDVLTVYAIQMCRTKQIMGHHDPLQDWEGMLSPKEFWLTRIHNTYWKGRRRPKWADKTFMFQLFLSCKKIWVLFHHH